MAWERRGRNGPYYIRSRRESGRVVRDYFGRSELAHALAVADAAEQNRRELAIEARRRIRDEARAADAELAHLGRELDALVSLVLEAHGYHRHRGQWRRRRMG